MQLGHSLTNSNCFLLALPAFASQGGSERGGMLLGEFYIHTMFSKGECVLMPELADGCHGSVGLMSYKVEFGNRVDLCQCLN